MNSSNLFILGLLLLTANLSFAAIFSPARAGGAETDRLLLMAKLALLASVQVGAWAVVLHQGGAAPTLIDSFTRSAACFTFVAGANDALLPPWGETSAFISLNGLLFIPVALLPWMRGSLRPAESQTNTPVEHEVPSTAQESSHGNERAELNNAAAASQSADNAAPHAAPSAKPSIPSAPEPEHETVQVKRSVPTESVHPPQSSKEWERGGFRPKIPKALSPNAPLSPEQELAEQMKPVGPTPPPIRFEWKKQP